MKIFGLFGTLSAAKEFKFDLSRLNDTSTRRAVDISNIMLVSSMIANSYAYLADKPELVTIFETKINKNDKNVWEYGCWGQVNQDEIQSGLGEPLDSFDSAFQNWKRCQECRSLDFGSSSMDDYFANMKEGNLKWSDSAIRRLVCVSEADIYRRRCECDEALAFALVQKSGDFNSEYELQNGFNFEASCKPHPKNPNNGGGGGGGGSCNNGGESQRHCCGEFPQRFPYDDKAGCMQCCNAATAIYNVNRHSCCGEVLGSVGCQ